MNYPNDTNTQATALPGGTAWILQPRVALPNACTTLSILFYLGKSPLTSCQRIQIFHPICLVCLFSILQELSCMFITQLQYLNSFHCISGALSLPRFFHFAIFLIFSMWLLTSIPPAFIKFLYLSYPSLHLTLHSLHVTFLFLVKIFYILEHFFMCIILAWLPSQNWIVGRKQAFLLLIYV